MLKKVSAINKERVSKLLFILDLLDISLKITNVIIFIALKASAVVFLFSFSVLSLEVIFQI